MFLRCSDHQLYNFCEFYWLFHITKKEKVTIPAPCLLTQPYSYLVSSAFRINNDKNILYTK